MQKKGIFLNNKNKKGKEEENLEQVLTQKTKSWTELWLYNIYAMPESWPFRELLVWPGSWKSHAYSSQKQNDSY